VEDIAIVPYWELEELAYFSYWWWKVQLFSHPRQPLAPELSFPRDGPLATARGSVPSCDLSDVATPKQEK
jgi:hypothetical protein